MRLDTGQMVGRDRDLRQLLAVVDVASTGTTTAAVLGGEAGVGKTRLLAELAHRAEDAGVTVLVGHCVETGGYGLPYSAIIDAVRTLARGEGGAELLAEEVARRPALARLLPELSPTSVSARDSTLDEGVAQLQLFDAVRGVLQRAAARTTLLLMLEDVHWADQSTRDLVVFLFRTLRDLPLAIVLSYRSDDLHRRHPLRPMLAELGRHSGVERLQLAALDAAQTGALVEARLGRAMPSTVLAEVWRRSEGNPFFAEELIDAYAVDGEVGLTTGLADILLSRVEPLAPWPREVLRAASVGDREISVALLAAVLDRDETETENALAEGVTAGLLLVDSAAQLGTGGFAFRHALVREAVHGDLLPGERVRLHAAYARELAPGMTVPGNLAGSVAEHRLTAHDLPGALEALVQAAAHAESVAAPAVALQHLENALSLLEPLGRLDRRLDLLRRAAEAADTAGEPERAAAFGRAAVLAADEAGDPVGRAMARERLARLLFEVDAEDPLTVVDAAIALLPAGPPSRERARLLATRLRMCDVDTGGAAQRRLDEAEREARDAGALDLLADILLTRARLERAGPRGARTEDLYDRALALVPGCAAPVIRLRALRLLATERFELGLLDAALVTAREGVELASSEGLAWSGYGLDLRLVEGWLLGARGEWDEVLVLARASAEAPGGLGQVLATLELQILARRGDPAAESLLARLRASLTDHYALVQTDLAEAEIALLAGDHRRAAEAAERRFDKMLEAGGAEVWLLAAARSAAAADAAAVRRAEGDETGAAGQAQLALGIREAVTATHHLHDVARLVTPAGRLWSARLGAEVLRAAGPSSEAADAWREAWQAATAAGSDYDAAWAAFRRAEALLELGRERDEALEALRHARSRAVSLGALPLRAAVDSLARRARLDGDLGLAEERAPASALTPRELEVLRLVADGLSNRAIGSTLFISEKTASVHVSNIMAKTGTSSRTEAASFALRGGLLPAAHPDHGSL